MEADNNSKSNKDNNNNNSLQELYLIKLTHHIISSASVWVKAKANQFKFTVCCVIVIVCMMICH